MTPEIKILMPAKITAELIEAVRKNDLCACTDKDEMNKRIGWLICAYDAMVESTMKGAS